MVINAPYPADPLKQRVRTPRLAILELILEQMSSRFGTAGDLLRISLGPNYQAANTEISHSIIKFDLGNETASAEHRRKMATLARQLRDKYDSST